MNSMQTRKLRHKNGTEMQELQSNFLGRMNQELHTRVCVWRAKEWVGWKLKKQFWVIRLRWEKTRDPKWEGTWYEMESPKPFVRAHLTASPVRHENKFVRNRIAAGSRSLKTVKHTKQHTCDRKSKHSFKEVVLSLPILSISNVYRQNGC